MKDNGMKTSHKFGLDLFVLAATLLWVAWIFMQSL
jgi:hypothetical protein